jgi:hypothetical protein
MIILQMQSSDFIAIFILGSVFADETTAETPKRNGGNSEKLRNPAIMSGQIRMTNPVWREGKFAYLHVTMYSAKGRGGTLTNLVLVLVILRS